MIKLVRRQWKTLSTIDERGSKIDRNSVFDCHLSPVWRQMAIENAVLKAIETVFSIAIWSVWRQMAIENTVSIDVLSTFPDDIGVFDCRLPGVMMT